MQACLRPGFSAPLLINGWGLAAAELRDKAAQQPHPRSTELTLAAQLAHFSHTLPPQCHVQWVLWWPGVTSCCLAPAHPWILLNFHLNNLSICRAVQNELNSSLLGRQEFDTGRSRISW